MRFRAYTVLIRDDSVAAPFRKRVCCPKDNAVLVELLTAMNRDVDKIVNGEFVE